MNQQLQDDLITNIINLRSQTQAMLLTIDQMIAKFQEAEGKELIEGK